MNGFGFLTLTPGGLVSLVAQMVKQSACDAGSPGWLLGQERSSGGGKGNPLQYSSLENARGQRSLVDYSPGGRKESVDTERLTLSLLQGTYSIS